MPNTDLNRRIEDQRPANPLKWDGESPKTVAQLDVELENAMKDALTKGVGVYRQYVDMDARAAAPQAELVDLLKAIRPNFGDVGTRDVDVAAQQKRIDRAIALLAHPADAGVEMDDPILIPRGLIGAACYLIRKHEPENTLLTKLRAFTFNRHDPASDEVPAKTGTPECCNHDCDQGRRCPLRT